MATSAFSQKLDFRCLTRFCNVSVFTPKQLPRIMTLLSWLVLKVVRRSSHWNGFLETRASKVLRNHEIQLQIEIPLKILWKELFFLQLLQTSEMWFLLKWNLSQIFSKDFTNLYGHLYQRRQHVQMAASMCFLLSFNWRYSVCFEWL